VNVFARDGAAIELPPLKTREERLTFYQAGGPRRPLHPPTYVLARAAWVPTLVLWHADGGFTRLEGEACGDYAAALAASSRLRPAVTGPGA